jgi:hypothetical protein
MFKGFDRAKYDLKDPSAWQAIKRDRALHEQALQTVARHLQTRTPPPPRPRVPVLLLPANQQASLTSQLPVPMLDFERYLPNTWQAPLLDKKI